MDQAELGRIHLCRIKANQNGNRAVFQNGFIGDSEADLKKKVLFLADVLVQESSDKRHPTNDILYRGTKELRLASAALPHATLLGPVLLGTILKQNGYWVEILECAFHPMQKQNLQAALGTKPDYILITTTFIEDFSVLEKVVAEVRGKCPNAILILGGPSLRENPRIQTLTDYGVLGEGEEAVLSLLRCLDRGDSPMGIPGIVRGGDVPTAGPPPRLIVDLDQVVNPDWSLVRRNSFEYFPLFTQRGCYWRCAFCTYPGNEGYKLRYRSVANLIDEMTWNYQKFGIQKYIFSDSTFTYPLDRCVEFLKAVTKLPFEVEWVAYARMDTLNSELAGLLPKSGCRGLFFGCDSGDETMLKNMNKRLTPEQILEGAALMKSVGVVFTTSWIFGFPGETHQSARNSLDLILKIRSPLNVVHTFTLYDQSPVGLRREKFGATGGSLEWTHQTMNSGQAKRWTRYVVLKLLSQGLRLGGVFEFPWFSTAGLSTGETLALMEDSLGYALGKVNLKPKRLKSCSPIYNGQKKTELLQRYELLRRNGMAHPLFQSREWFGSVLESTAAEPGNQAFCTR